MKDNYYIPNITDFIDGFEFEYQEYNEKLDCYTDNWIKTKFDSRCGLGDNLTHQFHESTIRTSFLTKEDIINNGWIYRETGRSKFYKRSSITEYLLDYNFNSKTLFIEKFNKGEDDDLFYYPYAGAEYIFVGDCKCINDFKQITNKFLKIQI